MMERHTSTRQNPSPVRILFFASVQVFTGASGHAGHKLIELSEVLPSSKAVLLFQAFRVGDQLSGAPGAKACLIELSQVLPFVTSALVYNLLDRRTCF